MRKYFYCCIIIASLFIFQGQKKPKCIPVEPVEVVCTTDADCDDNNICTGGEGKKPDSCVNGECVNIPTPDYGMCGPDGSGLYCLAGKCEFFDCDDGNDCTYDFVDSIDGQCAHSPIPGCVPLPKVFFAWAGYSGTLWPGYIKLTDFKIFAEDEIEVIKLPFTINTNFETAENTYIEIKEYNETVVVWNLEQVEEGNISLMIYPDSNPNPFQIWIYNEFLPINSVVSICPNIEWMEFVYIKTGEQSFFQQEDVSCWTVAN